ncbi:GTPase [Flagellimonas allohymeniacidonis]|uniref:GTPase n=1 Tax=Flagellimonas allohymeniacidonis TaxID=2517819 RepID=A0A4Q8Q9J2_9FLAO|nr:GTPase [Allomuricauda hymeniacidonis]TAI46881.1 GTPase [Allomuricauda hymeniacidonis]
MEKKIREKLIFVYNANSGARNAILDSMHKVFSPATYDCNLCDITFGVVSENRAWKKFRKEHSADMMFLHKDEFNKQYASKFGYKFTYPLVLVEGERGLEVFISTDELNQLKTSKELIDLITTRVS